LLVEAKSRNLADIAAAVNTAASMGVVSIDNSYAAGEEPSVLRYASAYNHPGIAIVAAGGGSNVLGATFPASFSTVIAVGPSRLQSYSNARGWNDSVYWGGNGGCSSIIPKPSWQHDTGCSMRTINDVAFDGDPGSTFPVYGHLFDLPAAWQNSGWASGATAAVAAIYALLGSRVNDASSLYYGASQLTDVTQGANQNSSGTQGGCDMPNNAGSGIVDEQSSLIRPLTGRRALGASSPRYFCTGLPGYDAPTGNGVPNGLAGFTATPPPVSPSSLPCVIPSAAPNNPNSHPTQNAGGSSCTS
jgi:hypothetical protein